MHLGRWKGPWFPRTKERDCGTVGEFVGRGLASMNIGNAILSGVLASNGSPYNGLHVWPQFRARGFKANARNVERGTKRRYQQNDSATLSQNCRDTHLIC